MKSGIERPPPTLRLTVDAEALSRNYLALQRLSGSAKAGAAVKADAYGIGIDACVPVLRDAGCDQFFVAHWSEVAAVSAHVPADRIAVLHGPLDSGDVEYARAVGAVPVINSIHQARIWTEGGGGLCHLMVDTGMNRLGVSLRELGDPVLQSLEVDTLMSHLACADEDSPLNNQQVVRFREAIPLFDHSRTSLANSAGIALGPDYHFDMTRPGLALYGGIPRPEMSEHIRQVAHLEAAIIQTRNLAAGDTVGYNATFTAPQSMRVATVSLGYADGFLRSWAGGSLSIGETRLPLLGRVSMDMVVVDLANAPHLRDGDWLTIPYHLPDAAQQSTLTQYELLTVLGHRLRA